MRTAQSPRVFGLLVLALVPVASLAHEEAGRAAGFVAGLLHPVSGFDHVLAMVAVGLWGAVLGPPALWILPIAFPMVMALGGLIGLLGISLPAVEAGIAGSAAVLGAMVLFEARLPLVVAGVIVAFFAVFHGHAHGRELPPGTSALLYSAGFVVATGALHLAGIAVGTAHRSPAGRVVVRATGAAIALSGLFFLWRAVS